MVNAEKEIYTAHSDVALPFSPTSPQFFAITNTVEGTSHGQRDGESIKLHGYRWNLRFTQQSSASGPQYVKLHLVKYIGPRGSTPAISTFLKPDFDGNYSFHSERNEDHYTSYNVIKTITSKISPDALSGMTMYTNKKVYGKFHYFRICELQKDGTPHFHVLLVGNNIIPKSFLQSIESLWRSLYGLGFVKLNAVIFQDAVHAIRYMLKYVTKEIKTIGFSKRLFSSSRGAMAPTVKTSWNQVHVYQGIHSS